MKEENKIKCGTISIKEIQENDLILSPNYYLNILPKLKEQFVFKNSLTNQTYKIKLNLEKLDLNTKLFIFDLLKARERLNKIREIERGF